MKIVFVGCVESSYRLLDTLLRNKQNVVGVITKKESSANADFEDLSVLCSEYGVDFVYVENINGNSAVEFLRVKNPDIIYCFGWSQIIKKEVLNMTPKGVIGFHPAQLPYNRGRHPIIWALALGLSHTASTFFKMDEGADTGDIISQELVEIKEKDYARDLYDRIMNSACKQVLSFTETLDNGTCVFHKQDQTKGNSWRKRGKADGKIDWRMSSRAIYNLVRALSHPYVGAHLEHQGQEYKVWRCEDVILEQHDHIEPGKVLRVVSQTEFYVKAYDHAIHVQSCDPIDLTEGVYL